MDSRQEASQASPRNFAYWLRLLSEASMALCAPAPAPLGEAPLLDACGRVLLKEFCQLVIFDLTDDDGVIARQSIVHGDAIDRASFRNLQRQEAKNGFREKPDSAETFFRVGKAGQWKDVLNRRQIRRIVEAHAPQMRRFGYLTDDLAHLAKD